MHPEFEVLVTRVELMERTRGDARGRGGGASCAGCSSPLLAFLLLGALFFIERCVELGLIPAKLVSDVGGL